MIIDNLAMLANSQTTSIEHKHKTIENFVHNLDEDTKTVA